MPRRRKIGAFDIKRKLVRTLPMSGPLRERLLGRRFLKAFLRTPQIGQLLETLERYVEQNLISREQALGISGSFYQKIVAYVEEVATMNPSLGIKINKGLEKNPKSLTEILGYNPMPKWGVIEHSYSDKIVEIHFGEKLRVMVRERKKKK